MGGMGQTITEPRAGCRHGAHETCGVCLTPGAVLLVQAALAARPLDEGPGPKSELPDMATIEARYKDLLERLGVSGHEGAIAEIEALRRSAGLGEQQEEPADTDAPTPEERAWIDRQSVSFRARLDLFSEAMARRVVRDEMAKEADPGQPPKAKDVHILGGAVVMTEPGACEGATLTYLEPDGTERSVNLRLRPVAERLFVVQSDHQAAVREAVNAEIEVIAAKVESDEGEHLVWRYSEDRRTDVLDTEASMKALAEAIRGRKR